MHWVSAVEFLSIETVKNAGSTKIKINIYALFAFYVVK